MHAHMHLLPPKKHTHTHTHACTERHTYIVRGLEKSPKSLFTTFQDEQKTDYFVTGQFRMKKDIVLLD